LVIAALTSVECASAFNRKLREGRFSARQLRQAWRLFQVHRRAQYRVVMLDEHAHRQAERLLFTYPLRAYDALQVTCALATARLLVGLVADFRFCTSDRAQAAAATSEGLQVELVP
jgi:predicted nucleic acid-binding protein